MYRIVSDILKTSTQDALSLVFSDKMPFFPTKQDFAPILNSIELERHARSIHVPLLFIEPISSNPSLLSMKNIIKELKQNNIKIIILITPLSSEYVDSLPESSKHNFEQILNELESEFDLQVYDFTHKYDGLSIWRDSAHVAENPKSIIFTEDVLNIIINNLEK